MRVRVPSWVNLFLNIYRIETIEIMFRRIEKVNLEDFLLCLNISVTEFLIRLDSSKEEIENFLILYIGVELFLIKDYQKFLVGNGISKSCEEIELYLEDINMSIEDVYMNLDCLD